MPKLRKLTISHCLLSRFGFSLSKNLEHDRRSIFNKYQCFAAGQTRHPQHPIVPLLDLQGSSFFVTPAQFEDQIKEISVFPFYKEFWGEGF
jgi:hypothetical protein